MLFVPIAAMECTTRNQQTNADIVMVCSQDAQPVQMMVRLVKNVRMDSSSTETAKPINVHLAPDSVKRANNAP